MQTSNLNSKFPDFYLIPKEQSAQREGRKEVERVLVEGWGKGKREEGREEREQRGNRSSPYPTHLLTSH